MAIGADFAFWQADHAVIGESVGVVFILAVIIVFDFFQAVLRAGIYFNDEVGAAWNDL